MKSQSFYKFSQLFIIVVTVKMLKSNKNKIENKKIKNNE
jgi:hypothetical protein